MIRTIQLPCYNIALEIDEENHSGKISHSELKEPCKFCGVEDCYRDCFESKCAGSDGDVDGFGESTTDIAERRHFNAMMDVIESMILAHACAGVDIESPAYIEGIETAVNAVMNHV